MARKKNKNSVSEKWIVVRFIDDNLLFLCPSKSIKKKIVIGNNYFIKWRDGYKYLAKVIKIGAKDDLETCINTLQTMSNPVSDKKVLEQSTEACMSSVLPVFNSCTDNDDPYNIENEIVTDFPAKDDLETCINTLQTMSNPVSDKKVLEQSTEACMSSVLPVFNSCTDNDDPYNIENEIFSDIPDDLESCINTFQTMSNPVSDKKVFEQSTEACMSSVLPVFNRCTDNDDPYNIENEIFSDIPAYDSTSEYNLDTYLTAPTEISQEEVEGSLSEMERQLTKQLKRIVIRGKRGRGVPILFTPAIQKSIQLLLKIREVTDFVQKSNPYLFALPYSENCLRGSDAIRKLSISSGVKNPENITSTRLRKQVATIAQLLNLSDGDIEQLSTFLGHSKQVHAQFYRLSESAFQVAKVGKLLLMLEKGNGHEFRGKSLDDININVDALVSDIEDHSSDEDINLENRNINEPKEIVENEKRVKAKKQIKIASADEINMVSTSTQSSIAKPRKFVRLVWSEDEKNATTKYFQKHIFLKKAPNKEECQNLKMKFPELFLDKPWKKIKTYVYNVYNNRH